MTMHPTTPALKSDGQPIKGETRMSPDGKVLYKDRTTSLLKPAIRMNEIRADLFARAAALGSYTYERPSGLHPDDKTAFLQEDKDFGEGWDQRPSTVFQIRPSQVQQSRKPEGVMMYNDLVVLDPYDHPVRNFPELPDCLSTKTSGMFIEHYLRKNLEIKAYDLMARMMENWVDSSGIIHHGGIRVNTLTERATKFRRRAALPAFDKRGGSDKLNERYLKLLPQGAESTRSLGRDRKPAEVKELLAPTKGSCPNKARKSKRNSNASQVKHNDNSGINNGVERKQQMTPILGDTDQENQLRGSEPTGYGNVSYEVSEEKAMYQSTFQPQFRTERFAAAEHQYWVKGSDTYSFPVPCRQQPGMIGLTGSDNSQSMLASPLTYASRHTPSTHASSHKRGYGQVSSGSEQMMNAHSSKRQRTNEIFGSLQNPAVEKLNHATITQEVRESPPYPATISLSHQSYADNLQPGQPGSISPAVHNRVPKRSIDTALIGEGQLSKSQPLKRPRISPAPQAPTGLPNDRSLKRRNLTSGYMRAQKPNEGIEAPLPATLQVGVSGSESQMPESGPSSRSFIGSGGSQKRQQQPRSLYSVSNPAVNQGHPSKEDVQSTPTPAGSPTYSTSQHIINKIQRSQHSTCATTGYAGHVQNLPTSRQSGMSMLQPEYCPSQRADLCRTDTMKDFSRNMNLHTPQTDPAVCSSSDNFSAPFSDFGNGININQLRQDTRASTPVLPVNNNVPFMYNKYEAYLSAQSQHTWPAPQGLTQATDPSGSDQVHDSGFRSYILNPAQGDGSSGSSRNWTMGSAMPQNQDIYRSSSLNNGTYGFDCFDVAIEAPNHIQDPSLDLSNVGQEGLSISGDGLQNPDQNYNFSPSTGADGLNNSDITFVGPNQSQDQYIDLDVGVSTGQQYLNTGGAAVPTFEFPESFSSGVEGSPFAPAQYWDLPPINGDRAREAQHDLTIAKVPSGNSSSYQSPLKNREDHHKNGGPNKGKSPEKAYDKQSAASGPFSDQDHDDLLQLTAEQTSNHTITVGGDPELSGYAEADPFSSMDFSSFTALSEAEVDDLLYKGLSK